MNADERLFAELKRANDLKEREIAALERMVPKPAPLWWRYIIARL